MSQNPYLEQFCRFMALKESNDNKPWRDWDNDSFSNETYFMWKLIQYEFFMQWAEIKCYAKSRGVKIIGDMPIYVSLESSDVWANKEQFLIDEEGLPECVAEVPPDYFSEDGQVWGNSLYNWKKMEKNGY